MTFKVNAKRLDKRFPMKSPEMSIDLGGYVLKTFPQRFKVDVLNPDLNITAELRADSNIIFADKIKGVGGLPRGINGKGCILLSGGIDSPVAAYLMSKRGLYIEAVHFHSFPFTSEKSQEKIMDLARTLLPYTGQIKIHMVNLLEIQQSIAENCPEELMTILSRRFMMAIAERIATETECNCLITGESMGQVASQTAEGLLATNNAVKLLPVFRPLISYDKEDIITLAKEIDTFDVSIIPEEDCCTVFLPKRPATKPKLEKILKAEENLNIEMLINNAIDSRVIKEMKKFE
jgi:thiamine biosynthesis protein ThiI